MTGRRTLTALREATHPATWKPPPPTPPQSPSYTDLGLSVPRRWWSWCTRIQQAPGCWWRSCDLVPDTRAARSNSGSAWGSPGNVPNRHVINIWKHNTQIQGNSVGCFMNYWYLNYVGFFLTKTNNECLEKYYWEALQEIHCFTNNIDVLLQLPVRQNRQKQTIWLKETFWICLQGYGSNLNQEPRGLQSRRLVLDQECCPWLKDRTMLLVYLNPLKYIILEIC